VILLAPASLYLEEAFQALSFHHDRQVAGKHEINTPLVLVDIFTYSPGEASKMYGPTVFPTKSFFQCFSLFYLCSLPAPYLFLHSSFFLYLSPPSFSASTIYFFHKEHRLRFRLSPSCSYFGFYIYIFLLSFSFIFFSYSPPKGLSYYSPVV
jgi:hypothetical protein